MTAIPAPARIPAARRPRVSAGLLSSLVVPLSGTVVAEATLARQPSRTSSSAGVALIFLLPVFASQGYARHVYRPGHRVDLLAVVGRALEPAHLALRTREDEQ